TACLAKALLCISILLRAVDQKPASSGGQNPPFRRAEDNRAIMTTATKPAGPTFQQRLGLFDATMLVAGSMIGSATFLLSSEIPRDVGSSGWLMLVWIVAGIVTVIGALSYAELAAMMPHAGGQYVYLREAFGPVWGFLYGWTLFLVIQTGTIAAVCVS